MKNKLGVLIWIVAAAAVMIAAYSIYSKFGGSTPRREAVPPAQSSTASDGSAFAGSGKTALKAPDFALSGLDGKTARLSDYKGRIVILNFWATWCTYCKQELPDFEAMNRDFTKASGPVILAIDENEDKESVESFVASKSLTLHVLLDSDGTVGGKYGVSGYPTTVFINRDGTLFDMIVSATDKKTVLEYIGRMK